MRAFEFYKQATLLENKANAIGSVISRIEQNIKKNPEKAGLIAKQLQAVQDASKKILSTVKEKSKPSVKKIGANPNNNAMGIAPVESLDEDSNADVGQALKLAGVTRETAMNAVLAMQGANAQEQADILLKILQKIEAESAETAVQQNKVTINKNLKEYLSKINLGNPKWEAAVNKAMRNLIMSEEFKGQQQDLWDFLEGCTQPSGVFDVVGIVKGEDSQGTIAADTKFQPFISELATLLPEAMGNAASGKGELLLATIGGPKVTSSQVGDLNVDGDLIEVKASDVSGSSGMTDFKLLDKLDTKKARKIFVDTINSVRKEKLKNATAKQGGVSAIGMKNLATFSQDFTALGLDKTREMFRQMILSLAKTKEDKDADEIDQMLSAIVEKDGVVTIDVNTWKKALKGFIFKVYQKTNKHSGVMAINLSNMQYDWFTNADSFAANDEIQLTSLFDFRTAMDTATSFKYPRAK